MFTFYAMPSPLGCGISQYYFNSGPKPLQLFQTLKNVENKLDANLITLSQLQKQILNKRAYCMPYF
jgi:hypothetical protein